MTLRATASHRAPHVPMVATSSAAMDAVGMRPLDIIGKDERQSVAATQAAPASQICLLVMRDALGRERTGTGWLAGPSTVFTAAHNLVDSAIGHVAASVRVFPGCAGDLDDSAHPGHDATQFDVHPRWRAGEAADTDLGVLWLAEPLGLQLGYLGYSVQPDAVLRGLRVRCAGYPMPPPSGADHVQWQGDGTVEHLRATMLSYDIDTTPGQSGAPVFARDENDHAVVLAVHVNGAVTENRGVRITQAVFDLMQAWWR